MANGTGARPVIFGEVLFDVFDDGEVLGGASFNVAWNLRALGADPLMITRVGDDARGERVRAAMEAQRMDLSGIQVDPERPTGIVAVEIHNGQPSYDIVANQAYDAIDAQGVEDAAGAVRSGLLYHGTLAIRDRASRAALESLRARFPAFVDINLRPPWWTRELVETSLLGARWAKLNHEEVATLADRESLAEHELEATAKELRETYELDELIVTLGSEGAFVVQAGEWLDCAPPAIDTIVDTVGAGDAFSAVTILGMIRGWSLPVRLRRAVEFAASVCQRRGGVSEDPADYAGFVERWAAKDAEVSS